jgi:hypothetical protein
MKRIDNEELLTAFSDYLQIKPLPAGITTPTKAVAILLEFTAEIDPVPLAEATLRDITVFERKRKVPAVSTRPQPFSLAHARTKYQKATEGLRYHEYRVVMESFRQFRKLKA